LAMFRAAVLNY